MTHDQAIGVLAYALTRLRFAKSELTHALPTDLPPCVSAITRGVVEWDIKRAVECIIEARTLLQAAREHEAIHA